MRQPNDPLAEGMLPSLQATHQCEPGVWGYPPAHRQSRQTMPNEWAGGGLMQDSRVKHACVVLIQALKTDDETYMHDLLLEARKVLTEVLQEF